MGIEDQVPGTSEGSNPALGFAGKLINIFTSPTKTFQELDQRPTWIIPFLIMVIITLATVLLTLPIIIKMAVDEIAKNPEASQEQIQIVVKTLPFTIPSIAVLWIVVWFFAFAGILYLVGTLFLGGDSTFKKILSVQSWSSLIIGLSSIVTIPIVMAKESVLVSLSLALLLPTDAIGTKLHALLSQIDFFNIWYLATMTLGFSTIYKFSVKKSAVTMVILWAIWIAISVIRAGLTGQPGV